MYLQLYAIFIIYGISRNFIYTQDFFQAQLSPSALTFVPYLNGEVAVYEHNQNRSRLFVPPLAALYLNQTRVFYNPFTKKNLLRLSLILFTNELRTTVLKYLSNTRNRCSPPQEICDVKMVPTERVRIVWKRMNKLSADYKLDTSWQSNTALLNTIDVQMECTTNQTCYQLLNYVLQTPDILNGFELEYSTQAEKQTRKVVTITGRHLMKTNMYSKLKQLPSSTIDDSVRYLLVDDMNQLITEILTKMEIEEVTDSDYILHDEQKILTEELRRLFSLNMETLNGHTERQWNSVYWNSDNIRPDRIVHLLSDDLRQLQNKTILEHQNQLVIQLVEDKKRVGHNHSYSSYDNSGSKAGSIRNKTDRFEDHAGSSSTSQTIIDQHSSDQSQTNAFGQSQSSTSHKDRSSSHGGSVGVNVSGFGIEGSYNRANTKIDDRSHSRSNYGINEWRNAFSKYSDHSSAGGHAWKDTQATGDDLSSYNESAWRRAATQDQQGAYDDSTAVNDVQSFQELRQKNYDFYTNNRQFIEFTGEKFIVKPVKAYRLNLATFQANTQFIHKSMVVSKIDLIHAVPFRILSLSSDAVLTKIPDTDNYTNVFEAKLHELNEKLALNEREIVHIKMSATTTQNNVKKLQSNTVRQLTEIKSSIATTQNNVETLQLNTDKQFTELKSKTDKEWTEFKSSETTIKNYVEKLKLHTIHSSPLVGEIKLYSNITPSLPCPWVFCHGQALSRIEYQRLFSVIGESFGAGDGKTTFNVPDFRDRFPLGLNPIKSPEDSWEKGGNKEQILTIDQMPTHHHSAGTLNTANAGTHTHTVNDPGHNHGGYTHHSDAFVSHLSGVGHAVNGYAYAVYNSGHRQTHNHAIPVGNTGITLHNDGTHSHSIGGSTSSVGQGDSFSIIPPYQTIAYIIFTGAKCA